MHCSHIDFLVDLQLRKMNIAIELTQKQRLIANEILLIPDDTIFIQTNMEKETLKTRKKIEARGKNEAGVEDKLMFSLRGLNFEVK